MLEHAENVSNAASVAAAITHSPMLNSTGLVVGTGVTASSLADINVNVTYEAGYWFTHAAIGIFTPQQICTIIGTVWIIICAINMAYPLIKSLKSSTKEALTDDPEETPSVDAEKTPEISAGSGSGHPRIS